MEQGDTFRHKGLRKKLIDSIRTKGISNEAVLEAMNRVPRHLFMDSSFINFSYTDKAFPIAAGQTISQPSLVGYMTELLDLQPGDRVLEIGTGSGYQAAVLARIAKAVYSIEIKELLYERSSKVLKSLGYKNITTRQGDGYFGWKIIKNILSNKNF